MLWSDLIELAGTQAHPCGDLMNRPKGWRRGLSSKRPPGPALRAKSIPATSRGWRYRRAPFAAATSITSAPASGLPSGEWIVPVMGGPAYGTSAGAGADASLGAGVTQPELGGV